MENLKIYNLVSNTPTEARKEIQAGRLKGMTDINPMWRIKKLTEVFGICGIGWKYVITSKKLENGCKGQISAFVDIDLFIKVNGEWSDAIPGTGGASFVTDERTGLYQSDECFKMALTDAISVSCKAIGMSSDIYFSKDNSKYTIPNNDTATKPNLAEQVEIAKSKIITATSLEDLKSKYTSLSKLEQSFQDVIELKDKLKLTLK